MESPFVRRNNSNFALDSHKDPPENVRRQQHERSQFQELMKRFITCALDIIFGESDNVPYVFNHPHHTQVAGKPMDSFERRGFLEIEVS
jgi:hypothetical protein